METYQGNDDGVTPSSQWVSGSSDNPPVQGRLHNDRAHCPPLWLVVAEKSYHVGLQRNHGKKGVKDILHAVVHHSQAVSIRTSGNSREVNVVYLYCGDYKKIRPCIVLIIAEIP